MVQSRSTFPETRLSSCSNSFQFHSSTKYFFQKQSHIPCQRLFLALWSYSSLGEHLSLDMKIIWMVLIVHEAGKLSLSTKLNSYAIGSHRLFTTHFTYSCSNSWISLALWFAKSFILAHISPFVKTPRSWLFRTKWSLILLSRGVLLLLLVA